jgi:hypothetical protein
MMRKGNAAGATRIGILCTLLALGACQTASVQDTLGSATEDDLTVDDLRAFCPRPVLREGTAILRTFTKNNENNPDEIIYQATITDVTRTCKYRDNLLYMTLAAAGRVVNGPKGSAGDLELPVRVAIKQGENLPYSELGKITVAVAPGAGATQFIYKDERIAVPATNPRGMQVFVGFDEGPYDTP